MMSRFDTPTEHLFNSIRRNSGFWGFGVRKGILIETVKQNNNNKKNVKAERAVDGSDDDELRLCSLILDS